MTDPRFLVPWRRRLAAAFVLTFTTLTALVVTPTAASASTGTWSFNAGVFERGQVRGFVWNNANSDAYAVGLEATGADDATDICDVEVTRTWYARQPSGEREFHLVITGDGVVRCQVRVWLRGLADNHERVIGSLAPGATWSGWWNNAHTDSYIYLMGVLGQQLTTGACQIEVTPFYRTQPTGETEFGYTVRNVGDYTCSATLLQTTVPVGYIAGLSSTSPGGRLGIWPGPLVPHTSMVVAAGAAPATKSAGACAFTPQPLSYYHPGTIHIDYVNTGTVACGLTATFALL